jgi:hypothetical protein
VPASIEPSTKGVSEITSVDVDAHQARRRPAL